jgi:hypothetical protein
MIWLYIYLAIGAVAALISCFTPPAQKASVAEVVIVVLVFVLIWPVCLFGEYLKGLTKDADGNR